MPLDLDDFEARTAEAVKLFWNTRLDATERQRLFGNLDQGERSAVTSGKTMDGFAGLIANLVHANGLFDADVHLTRGVTSLPGYFRATKDWDVVVVRGRRLIAAIELKSQVGPSFGNNFNNRTEEALGSAVDLWTAYREGAFGDARRPFVGWLMHVEDAPGSRRPTTTRMRSFSAFPELANASYINRYEVFCRRLVLEQHYTEAALICSTRTAGPNGEYNDVSESTSLRRFVTAFSAHVAAEAQSLP